MYDFRIHRENVNKENISQIQDEMIKELKSLGSVFGRMTLFEREEILVLEGWKTIPEDQGLEPLVEEFIGFGT